jgi:hypothetical protein
MEQEAKEFETLKPPRGKEAAYRRLLKFIHDDKRILADFVAAARTGDAGQLRAVGERARKLPARGVAQELGLSDCAKAA